MSRCVMAGHPQITSLDLSRCYQITDEALPSLAQCPKLAQLVLHECHHITKEGEARMAAHCDKVSQGKTVVHL